MPDFYTFIPFLVFFILFFISIKRKNKIAASIIGLYLLSAISSFFVDSILLPEHQFENDTLSNFVIYTVLLAFFLYLTLYIKPLTDANKLPSGRLLNWMMAALSVGAVYSFVYLLPYALISMSKSAMEIRLQIVDETILPVSPLTTIAVAFTTFYYIYAFLFYIAVIQKRHFIIKAFMLLGVLNFVVNVLTVAGRDGFLFVFFAMILAYFYLEPLFTPQVKKIFKLSVVSIVVFGAIVIIKITADRFSATGEFNLQSFKGGIVNYLGMQPYIFNDWINLTQQFHYGHNNFPLYADWLGIDGKKVEYTQSYTWQFGTFIASFYGIAGMGSMIMVSFLFWLYFRTALRKLNKYSFISKMFLLGLFAHFMISGVFYFRLGNSEGNYFILISLIVIIFFNVKSRPNIAY